MELTQLYIDELRASLTEVEEHNFPEELKALPFWVIWQAEHKPKENNPQKIIKNPLGKSWKDRRIKFDDLPDRHFAQGYGFLYNDEHPYVCIDIDLATPVNDRLIKELDSYTEWSPSMEGLHVIVETDDKDSVIDILGQGKRNTKEKRDLYVASGFVTITGKIPPFIKDTRIKQISADDLINILSPYFLKSSLVSHPSVLADAEKSVQENRDRSNLDALEKAKKNASYAKLTYTQVQAMLKQIPVQCLTDQTFVDFDVIDLDETTEAREPWLIVGQALHHFSRGDLKGFMLWQEWSKEGEKYDADALEACWNSFSVDPKYTSKKITIATIIKLIKAQQPQYVDYTSKGVPLSTIENAAIFTDFYKFNIRYNTTTTNTEIILPDIITKPLGLPKNHVSCSVRDASEFFISELTKHGFAASSMRPIVRALIRTRAAQNVYNPVAEYFQTIIPKWDGHDHIDDLMRTVVCQPEKRGIYKLYVKKWLVEVMAAVFSTAQKPNRLNNVLIIQGVQGIGKTMWVESLFPKEIRAHCVGSKIIKMSNFRSDMVKLNMELTSTLICNINEIDSVFDPKTYSDFKAFLDQTVDKVVLPYGDAAIDIVRRTVFIGSTNKTNFLTDPTGNRRFMIMHASSLNYMHKVDIEQLWAQAYKLYKDGEIWWMDPKRQTDKEAAAIQRLDNSAAMDMGSDVVIDILDSLFDTSAPVTRWRAYTFPQIRQLLNLSTLHGITPRMIKKAVVLWRESIPGAPAPRPKHSGIRAPWLYDMPPFLGTEPTNEEEGGDN